MATERTASKQRRNEEKSHTIPIMCMSTAVRIKPKKHTAKWKKAIKKRTKTCGGEDSEGKAARSRQE